VKQLVYSENSELSKSFSNYHRSIVSFGHVWRLLQFHIQCVYMPTQLHVKLLSDNGCAVAQAVIVAGFPLQWPGFEPRSGGICDGKHGTEAGFL
jgi:hypothetical protein